VRVAVVQAGAPTRDPGLRAERLARHVALSSADDGTRGADVIVWPESALDGYLQEPSAARTAVLDLARSTGADLVVGGPHYERGPDGTRYHNSAFLVRGDDVAARYDKHRLVPFAEDGRGAHGGGSVAMRYTAGTGTTLLAARGLRAGMLLCFEAMFPALAREATRDGADVLFNLSNDGWFGRPEAAQMQLDIASLRAVESRRFLVRAAATGISAVIDPHGTILERSAFGTHEVLAATVRPSHVRTLYQRWGDAPAWLLIAGAVLATLRAAIRPQATVEERKVR
jgi:apolipoprotein N-acyltransferase